MGGPFEEVAAAGNADPRFRELFATWRRLDQLEQGVAAIPSAHPIHSSIDFTSGYGVRSDPFRGRAAMHAGIDLAGPLGTPIYATADGIVGRAEWNNGGYGNLVEINHGQGIQTRYGHLSRFAATRRPARPPRPADRLYGLDRPLDRQPPPLRGPHRRPRRQPDPLHAAGQRAGRAAAPATAIGAPAAIGGPTGGPAAPAAARTSNSARERPPRPKASPATAGPFPLKAPERGLVSFPVRRNRPHSSFRWNDDWI